MATTLRGGKAVAFLDPEAAYPGEHRHAARLRAGEREDGREIGDVAAVHMQGQKPGAGRAAGVQPFGQFKNAHAHFPHQRHDAAVTLQGAFLIGRDAHPFQNHALAHGVGT